MSDTKRSRKLSKAKVIAAIGAVVAANAIMRHQGYDVPGRTTVRCSKGHEFTTLWIAGVSLNSVRLGPTRRFQRCPECRKWRIVRLLKPGEAGVPVAV
ncbi:MAG TPA: hypothetical protein VGS61_00455 [Acidimicrobiales bacterium]|nr:hypothetical protein [Acidimicrobiales bacterium]